ncbi:MAG TPA: 1-deoxy-D-xylulose-5-phosphate synthase [Candidatus Baltobacteraceae bacterium]|jgi:1-deoxy-D-xylulose-5-phosphate synthase|nr:1-deoxy-D-xylulose-5-phosphate synthase [Candidatus Baltobacteraceae bacterium]
MLIDRIDSPADLKRLPRQEIDALAQEIRDSLIAVCASNGGHLAPNLGVVELTLALHRVLDLPRDRIVWDVSHQSYVHKLLTGRRDRFGTIRKGGGLSGFAMRSESEFDCFGAGHASTSVSAALGMAKARDLAKRNETIVAVLGDGALTGGLAYEALNNAGQLRTNFIVILNDNEMSIAPNVGSIASYLSVLRSKPIANFARQTGKTVLDHLPLGSMAKKAFESAELGAMRFIAPSEKAAVIFEELGFRYIGPVDGHNFDAVVDALQTARAIPRAVLLHVRTVKGRGYEPAEKDSRTFHGLGAFDKSNGQIIKKPDAPQTFSQAFGDAMIAAGNANPRVVGITAAMPDGTGLAKFGKAFPDRYFDVGIAEAHAVCFAAGLATSGYHPVCAIYSTFLQRAYDQIVHDVCIQNLPVVFCMDRAGFVGDDGPTHMGLYDIAYLRTLPNMTLMAPRNESELLPMLQHALTLGSPAAIRYPRGSTAGKYTDPIAPIVQGRAEVLRRGSGAALLAYGNTVDVALEAYDLTKDRGVTPPTVVNMRFAKPLDEALLMELDAQHSHVLTLEEHSLAGGFGSAVVEFVSDHGLNLTVERLGVPNNALVQHDSQPKQRALFGLTGENVAARVASVLVAPVRP